MRIFALIIISICFWSCKESLTSTNTSNADCADNDYSNCNTIEPTHGYLQLRLSINSENPSVPLVIFKGNFDVRDTLFLDTATISPYRIAVSANDNYTVAAKYKSGDKIIHAIDGGVVKKEYFSMCDSTCWQVSGPVLHLELKDK